MNAWEVTPRVVKGLVVNGDVVIGFVVSSLVLRDCVVNGFVVMRPEVNGVMQVSVVLKFIRITYRMESTPWLMNESSMEIE